MGDIADYLIEQGLDALAMHEAGLCEDFCQDCEEEYQAELKKLKKKKKPKKRKKP
jgi:hypothetical protein